MRFVEQIDRFVKPCWGATPGQGFAYTRQVGFSLAHPPFRQRVALVAVEMSESSDQCYAIVTKPAEVLFGYAALVGYTFSLGGSIELTLPYLLVLDSVSCASEESGAHGLVSYIAPLGRDPPLERVDELDWRTPVVSPRGPAVSPT